ncbi:MAG TPA: glutaredoxin family protein [Campylobacterales bacterium]|nr:glutaredoxin family protein [Campylobacterales bacterium]
MSKSQKSVVLFTSPSCVWCKRAKAYFKTKGIRFKAIDVTKDPKAEMDVKRKCRGLPVVLIGGTKWICGFDQKQIEKSLGL